MLNKTLSTLSVLLFLFFSCLICYKMQSVFSQPNKTLLIPYNDVKGISIFVHQKEYPLNFEQQNMLLTKLNQQNKLEISLKNKIDQIIDFEKIIIYRFKKPDLTILNQTTLNEPPFFNEICLNNF